MDIKKTEFTRVRIDKWLWAVRIFKTRYIASTACNAGKIKISNKSVKPSRNIFKGEVITVQKDYVKFTYEVLDIIEKRVSAERAVYYCKNITPEEEMQLLKEFNKSAFYRPPGQGRPSKKERRDLDKARNN